MATMVLTGGVKLHEGVITSEENKRFFDELRRVLRDSSAVIEGGSLIDGKVWLGIGTINSGESIHAQRIMKAFGLKDLVVNGTYYCNNDFV